MPLSLDSPLNGCVARLPNGLTVLAHQDGRFPLVSLRLYARVGSALEPPAQAGISHVLEHMVFKGSLKRPPGRAAADIEGAGGYLNAATSFDYTVYIAELPHRRLDLGLDVLRDMTCDALLDSRELAVEKRVILSELERNEDSPTTRIFNGLQAMLWAEDGYARPIIGFRDTVAAIRSSDLKRLRSRFYQPQSLLLVICGKIRPRTALAAASEAFGSLANSRVMDIPPQVATAHCFRSTPEVRVEFGPWNKAYLGLALPLPPAADPGTPGCEVLAQMLGGDNTSLLYRKYKYDLRLVDTLSVSCVTLERRGMLLLQATLDPACLDPLRRGLARDLAELTEDAFSDRDLQRAKLNLEDSLLRSRETLGGLASKLGYFQLFEHGPQSERDYLFNLARTDRSHIADLLSRHMRPERSAAMVLLPESARGLHGDETAQSFGRQLAAGAPKEAGIQGRSRSAPQRSGLIPLAPGCSLALLPDNSLPYVAMDLVFSGGDGLLAPGRQGLSQLCSRVLTKGAAGKPATQIQDLLGDCAASLFSNANRDQFSLHARFPARFSDQLLDLFARTLLEPDFPQEELEREARNQAAAIRATEDKPLGLAFRRLFPLVFGDHHYAYLHLGREEDLPGFSREELLGFWRAQTRAPWTLAVCGDFDPKAVQDLAADLANNMGPAQDAPQPARKPNWTTRSEARLTLADRNQAHLLLAFPSSPLAHAATPGLKLLKIVLGGQGGMLFPRLRDELGLGYQVSVYNWQGDDAGFLALYLGTQPERMDEALKGFEDLLADLSQTPVENAAIERGAQLMLGNYFREHQGMAARSVEAATLAAHGLPLDANRKHLARARRMTPETLRSLIRSTLAWDKAFILRILP